MKKIFGFCFLLCLIIVFSCEKKEGSDTGIKQIKYGYSFGMCLGYCYHEITLKQSSITYESLAWNDTAEPISCTASLSDESWKSFKSGADTEEFFALEEIYGCPDCADGGAEWVEIELFSGEKHKVNFEYMNEPNELHNFVNELRDQMIGSSECQ